MSTFQVLRYSIPLTDEFTLPIAAGAVPLSVAPSRQAPNSHIDVWVRTPVDRSDRTEYAVLRIAGTGHPVDDGDATTFLGTVVLPSGLVFHVFYRRAATTDHIAIR
ncbi:hypothetical protein CH300_20010 [Rhodococcus sp. 15-1154-1]|nr:hypothetical protein [Rhodococcus sp. 15-1154-1]OZF00829.1 hypothetical protein CH300_20010 [Rhodococcus sp. 15-1154-1]